MCHLENKVLQNPELRPFTYCRYVDDIFVEVRSESHLMELQQAMESSVLKFTYELNLHNKIPFLDILISSEDDQYQTTVYRKKTDIGRCLNAASECPQRYKLSVIRAYLRRAFRNCSSWTLFHQELSGIMQILSNNGYSNTVQGEDEELEASTVEEWSVVVPPGQCPIPQLNAGDHLDGRPGNENATTPNLQP
ncbi:uncharacterized protein LOC143028004 [Oratosquilla oratoria]|uniref:uncharacterized protein LOC143028004 n=1 Tax=Oratosquilla oratoria TaxID=337810 RepID=UPI003F773AFB